MGQNTSPAVDVAAPYGMVVSFSDWNNLIQAVRVRLGQAIVAQQGVLNARSLFQPLNVIPSSGMVITAGGTNQFVLTDGFWCTGPAQNFTVPTAPASGNPRKDILCVQSNLGGFTIGTVTRSVENASGSFTPTPVNQIEDSVSYQYVQGDQSGSTPSAPVGWNTYAVLTIPAGTTAITAAMIAYAFPPMNPQGPTGSAGVAGANGASPNPRGVWNSAVSYNVLDIVSYNGGSYICSLANTNVAPSSDPTKWTSLAAQGQQGLQGLPGTNGTNGTNGQNGVSLNPRGAWNAGTNYAPNDFVRYGTAAYVALAPSIGVVPSTDATRWMPAAYDGTPGAPGTNGTNGTNGAPGPQGPPGAPVSTTTSAFGIGAPGSTVSAGVTNPLPYPFGSFAIVSDGSSAIYGQVTASSGTVNGGSLTLRVLVILAGGGTMSGGATVTFSGPSLPSFVGMTLTVIGAVGAGTGTGAVAIQLPNDGGTWRIAAHEVLSCANTRFDIAFSGPAVSPIAGGSVEGTTGGANNSITASAFNTANATGQGQGITVTASQAYTGQGTQTIGGGVLNVVATRIA